MRAEKKKREKDGKLGNLETLKLGNSDGGKVETGERRKTWKLGNFETGKLRRRKSRNGEKRRKSENGNSNFLSRGLRG